MSPEEKAQIVAWAKADERNKAELTALYKLHTITIWQEASTDKRPVGLPKPESAFIYKIASVAAILLLAVCSGYVFQLRRQMPEALMQTIHVPPGQRVEVVLTDNTSVWLNAGSTFTFPNIFPAGSREVILDGEAYFHVKRNGGKSFTVRTPSCDIVARGTEFNVLAYKQSSLFEVSLLNGIVDVYSEKGNIRLEPNTRLYRKNHLLRKERIVSYNPYLWKEGLICFDDEPVDDMIGKLELYYDVKIVVQNDSFKRQRYTGKFRTKDGIEHILKVFQLKDRFSYEKDDEKNRIVIK